MRIQTVSPYRNQFAVRGAKPLQYQASKPQPQFGHEEGFTDLARFLKSLMQTRGVPIKDDEAAILAMNGGLGIKDPVYGINHDGAGLKSGPLISFLRLYPHDADKREAAFKAAFVRIVRKHAGPGLLNFELLKKNPALRLDMADLFEASFDDAHPPRPELLELTPDDLKPGGSEDGLDIDKLVDEIRPKPKS